jgi:acetyl esterase/lipase
MPVPIKPEPLRIPVSRCAIPAAWAEAEAIDLWPGTPPGGPISPGTRDPALPDSFLTHLDRPQLRVFRPEESNGAALLVLPGGGYRFVSIKNEGVDVAEAFCPRGYTVFVLTYRLPGEGWAARADVPLQDAQRAMRLIRARATGEGYQAAAVSVLGFSAGGHLAASLLVGAAEQLYDPVDAADALSALPLAGGLLYPVVAMAGPDAHTGSREALLGVQPDAAAVDRRSPLQRIGAATPPMFVAHSRDDADVPCRNAQLLADAMAAADRPIELHLFEEGGHGFGIGPANGTAGCWPILFDRWLRRPQGLVER